jgi:hypothetical protein
MMFKLKNKEFTIESMTWMSLTYPVDSTVPSSYFAEMEVDGGMGKYPANKCGAKYGGSRIDTLQRDAVW